ncbi:hypothetical protein J4218_04665 [Candidatus Pacearchaeota archaeon]|nr:hypothetical protein [Candidatus Pacearchaeota archaeon]
MTRKSLLTKAGIATALVGTILGIGYVVKEAREYRDFCTHYEQYEQLKENSPEMLRQLSGDLADYMHQEKMFSQVKTPEEIEAARKAYDASHNVKYGTSQDRVIPLTSNGITTQDARPQK